jgi:hypothetical protein
VTAYVWFTDTSGERLNDELCAFGTTLRVSPEYVVIDAQSSFGETPEPIGTVVQSVTELFFGLQPSPPETDPGVPFHIRYRLLVTAIGDGSSLFSAAEYEFSLGCLCLDWAGSGDTCQGIIETVDPTAGWLGLSLSPVSGAPTNWGDLKAHFK